MKHIQRDDAQLPGKTVWIAAGAIAALFCSGLVMSALAQGPSVRIGPSAMHPHTELFLQALAQRRSTGTPKVAAPSRSARLAVTTQQTSTGTNPNPIPGGFLNPFVPGQIVHVSFPPGADPSTITDFSGLVAVAMVFGTGTATDTTTGIVTPGIPFSSDVRFMKGNYVGVDGITHTGTFAFV